MKVNVTKLRQIREAKGLSLRDLEWLSGIRHNTIWRIENGKTSKAHRGTVIKLASALGVDPTDLLLEGGLYVEIDTTNDTTDTTEAGNDTTDQSRN
jgi:transcriptional regulator with XRE-family HTH domain